MVTDCTKMSAKAPSQTNVYKNYTGAKIFFKVYDYHDGASCKEYVVIREAFSVFRWIFLTVMFSAAAFQYELYNKDVSLLGVTLILLSFILLIKLHYKVKQESLLVMASLGLQLTTKFATGHQVSKFIHLRFIKDIIINEGITMHQVLIYLALILKDSSSGKETLMPLFQYTFPPLACLKTIYRGVQETLFSNR